MKQKSKEKSEEAKFLSLAKRVRQIALNKVRAELQDSIDKMKGDYYFGSLQIEGRNLVVSAEENPAIIVGPTNGLEGFTELKGTNLHHLLNYRLREVEEEEISKILASSNLKQQNNENA